MSYYSLLMMCFHPVSPQPNVTDVLISFNGIYKQSVGPGGRERPPRLRILSVVSNVDLLWCVRGILPREQELQEKRMRLFFLTRGFAARKHGPGVHF